MKRLLSSIAMALMLSSVGMAQGVSPGPAPHPPGSPRVTVRTRGPMARFRGPMMRRFRGPMAREWWKNPYIAQRIGLTTAQRQQLDKIFFQNRLRMIDLRAALEKQRLLLQPMLQSEHPNEEEVLGQIDKIGQARTEMDRARVQAMLAARNVLTSEQWQKLRAARRWGPRPMIMRLRARPGSAQPSGPPAGSGR